MKYLPRSLALAGTVAAGMAWGLEISPSDEISLNEARQAQAVAASAVPPTLAITSLKTIAGEYSFGNGFDLNCSLILNPSGEFLYRQINCAEIVDEVRGKAKFSAGKLDLSPETSKSEWLRGTGTTLVPIPWGQRLYLIPGNDLLGFVNQVNRGIEPISHGSAGSYFLREGDWDRETDDLPQLPHEWSHYLLACPVTGQVIGRDQNGRWMGNVGQSQGIYLGMEIIAQNPTSPEFTIVRVADVGPLQCSLEAVDPEAAQPMDRWMLATRHSPRPCP